mmetsp:Transcript_118351/g.342143  ORF Transcript_118351/g.342143 Transcript_118351/m.342143 type:complete len:207 (-) Transcript_118351:66-686(-)
MGGGVHVGQRLPFMPPLQARARAGWRGRPGSYECDGASRRGVPIGERRLHRASLELRRGLQVLQQASRLQGRHGLCPLPQVRVEALPDEEAQRQALNQADRHGLPWRRERSGALTSAFLAHHLSWSLRFEAFLVPAAVVVSRLWASRSEVPCGFSLSSVERVTTRIVAAGCASVSVVAAEQPGAMLSCSGAIFRIPFSVARLPVLR